MRSIECSTQSSVSRVHDRSVPVLPCAGRRGSALVIVIGTLALISVFAAIYLSVGRADVRAVATQQSRAVQEDFSDRYAEHIAQIIAMDRFDATMQYADANKRYQVPRRETTDAPYTDWSARSESDDPAEWFFPAGGNPVVRSNSDDFDPRVASDPWLADLRPTYLGRLGLRNVTPFSEDTGGGSGFPAFEGFLDRRDWKQISNLAPDGRFVNLFNLRPQASPFGPDDELGGFDSEPGWGVTRFDDGREIRRMSEGLSLYEKRDLNEDDSAIRSFDPFAGNEHAWVPGQDEPVDLDMNPDEVRNTPAVWSMYQRFALIPMNQPFVTYNRDNRVSSWADPDFPAYQWGDADGDGFADSRWFELTEAREAHGTSTAPRDDVQRLYDAGEFRVFAAARVVDLSAMVNINTARDSLIPATADYPLGLSPAEVDLRRLLTMQDLAEDFDGDLDPDRRLEPLSYSALRAPAIDNAVAQEPALRPASDYSRYRHLLRDPDPPMVLPDEYFTLDPGVPGQNGFPTAPDPNQGEFANAGLLGRYAASAIHESIVRDLTLPAAESGPLSITVQPPVLTEASVFQRPDVNGVVQGDQLSTEYSNLGEQRLAYYDRVGSINPLKIGVAGTRVYDDVDAADRAYFGSGLFGIEDLAELLTFHGLNDPDVTTRLESTVQGRFRFEGGTGDERLSPLLSTRPLELDRDLHGAIPVNRFNPNRGIEIDGRMSRESMALMTLSVRSKMTTISGAVPFRPMSVAGSIGRAGNRLNIDPLTDGRDLAISLDAGPSLAFSAYAGALAGELEVYRLKRNGATDGLPPRVLDDVWVVVPTDRRDNPYATLFYGHRGPELALRIAAHAAVNATDLVDTDTTPTVATLVLDNDSSSVRDPLERFARYVNRPNLIFDPTNRDGSLALLYPGLGLSSNLFDLDAGRENRVDQVLPDNQLPDGRRLVSVYGVEPTPVITEVASMYVYTDAAQAGGGDDDAGGDPPRRPRPDLFPVYTPTQVTIDDSLNDANEDLLMHVIAFQITNPFDESISLGGGSGPNGEMWRGGAGGNEDDRFDEDNNLEFNYYIEYNGRFFKLGEFQDYFPPVNNPGFVDYGAGQYTDVDLPPIVPGTAIPDADRNYDELRYRNITLGPGESRVFFATGHTQLLDVPSSVGGLDGRWNDIVFAYDQTSGTFQEFNSLTITAPNDNDADLDGLPDGQVDQNGWTGLAQEWLQRAFTSQGSISGAHRIHPFNPETGDLLEGSGTIDGSTTFVHYNDETADPSSFLSVPGRERDPRVVRLWRKHLIPGGEEVPVSVNSTIRNRQNFIQNDQLVDRLYLVDNPAPPVAQSAPFLDVSYTDSDGVIANSVSFREDLVPVSNPCAAIDTTENELRNDNTGITFTRWASARRLDTARDLTNQESEPSSNLGRVESYMISSAQSPLDYIERRSNAPGTAAITNPIPDDLSIEELFEFCIEDQPEFAYNGKIDPRPILPVRWDVAESPHAWIAKVFPVRREAPVYSMAFHPLRRNNIDQGVPTGLDDRMTEDRLDAPAGGLSGLFDGQSDELRPEIILGTPDLDGSLTTGRVTDALRAMGIGPAYAPNLTANPRNVTSSAAVFDDEWMTLSEALAIGLGYEDFTPVNLAVDTGPGVIWFDTARTLAGGGSEYVLDDLRLRLDDYIAFMNLQRAGEVGADQKSVFSFNPAAPANADIRRGTGVPMALGVLDAFRGIGLNEAYPGDPTNLTERALISPVMGLVNINTAPIDVLRLLPGLSPSAFGFRPREAETVAAPRPEWWAAQGGLEGGNNLGIGDNAMVWSFGGFTSNPAQVLAENPDVAAGLAAYRDRLFADPRNRSNPNLIPAVFLVNPMSYAPIVDNNTRESFLDNRYGELELGTYRTRSEIAGIPGLRGTPGFGSLGEMLMASVRDDADTLPSPGADLQSYRQLSMRQYADDGENLGVEGTGDNAVSLSPAFVSGGYAGTVEDDYVEQLAAAAGVMNLTTTRSDYYAVWMVLQGFRESDVAGLRENDPLVPSFKRRFLMVVDRSNVVETGDAPRIVLFREVPL